VKDRTIDSDKPTYHHQETQSQQKICANIYYGSLKQKAHF